jgi:hypothetical protein
MYPLLIQKQEVLPHSHRIVHALATALKRPSSYVLAILFVLALTSYLRRQKVIDPESHQLSLYFVIVPSPLSLLLSFVLRPT